MKLHDDISGEILLSAISNYPKTNGTLLRLHRRSNTACTQVPKERRSYFSLSFTTNWSTGHFPLFVGGLRDTRWTARQMSLILVSGGTNRKQVLKINIMPIDEEEKADCLQMTSILYVNCHARLTADVFDGIVSVSKKNNRK